MLDFLALFCLHYLDPIFATFIYNWNWFICVACGTVISIVPFIFMFFDSSKEASTSDSTTNSKLQHLSFRSCILLSFLAITLSIMFSAYVYYCNQNYAEIPNITYYSVDYLSAIGSIDATTQQKARNFTIKPIFDASAEAKISEGTSDTASSNNFKVYGISVPPKTVLNVNSTIYLYVTWSSNSQIVPISDSDAPSYTGRNALYRAYTNSVQITCNPIIGTRTSNFSDGSSSVTELLYFYPQNEPLTVLLVDAASQKTVQAYVCNLGEEINFSNLPYSTYYYVILSDHFQPYVSDFLFELTSDSSAEYASASFRSDLIMNNYDSMIFSDFRVQVRNYEGSSVPGASFYYCIASDAEDARQSPNSYSAITNEVGLLLDSYDITQSFNTIITCDFHLVNGFSIYLLCPDNSESYPVIVSGDIGIATVPSIE